MGNSGQVKREEQRQSGFAALLAVLGIHPLSAARSRRRQPQAASIVLLAALFLALANLSHSRAAECERVIYSDSFDRANNVNPGNNDNFWGGAITTNWVENDDSAPSNHSITNSRLRLYGGNPDSRINHNFKYEELSSKFAVEFDLTIDSGDGNAWCAILFGMGTGLTSAAGDIYSTPLGILFKPDNLIVVWDDGFNNSQVPYDGMNGWATNYIASWTNSAHIRIEIDNAAGFPNTGDNNRMRLYIGGIQFTNLRNAGLTEYAFGWSSGSDFYIAFESSNILPGNKAEKYIDSLKILVQNNPPVATNLHLGVEQGGANTMQIIGGKHKPTDVDNDTLTVSAVSSPTPAGATVTTDGTNVTVNYSAVGSFSGADNFTYTVSDGRCTDTKTVYVNVSAGGTGSNIRDVSVVGGTVTVQAFGIPGYTYRLQYTASLTPVNWVDVAGSDQAAGSNGQMTLTGAAGGSGGYYRTKYVSGP